MGIWKLTKPADAVRLAVILAFLLATPGSAHAERLPIKTYTTADGLAHERVRRIVRDSRGLLWFCTIDGLSKFDGYRFTTYRAEQGLPASAVNDLLETSQGVYWIATEGGLCRFNPTSEKAASRFENYRVGVERGVDRIQTLYEDHAGRIWLGTANGLFQLQEINGQASFQEIEIGNESREQSIWSMAEGEHGNLWLGTSDGLIRFSTDGRSVHYRFQVKGSSNSVRAVLRGRDGIIWLGLNTDVFAFNPALDTNGASYVQVPADAPGLIHPSSGTAGQDALLSLPPAGRAVRFTVADGLDKSVRSLYQTADGHIWTSTDAAGAVEIEGGQIHLYNEAQGLSGNAINTFAEDGDGNLWFGSDTGGALKLTRNGFVGFFTSDGLGHPWIGSIFEQGADNFYVLSGQDFINQFDGQRFEHVRIATHGALTGRFVGALRDHAGEWWIARPAGLYRFSNVKRISQLPHSRPRIYTPREGLGAGEIARLFEDSRGDMWVFTRANGALALSRWRRANGTWRQYTDVDGLPSFSRLSGFVEDRAGDLWIGLNERGLARFRNERFEFIQGQEKAAFNQTTALHVDASGRLWVLLSQGALYACDDPAAEQALFSTQAVTAQLQLANATCMTSDLEGRLYFGTPRGIERLNVRTGRVNHYTTAEGLCNNEVSRAFRDRHGALWFATLDGLARFWPEPERNRPPPPVFIGGLHIAGVAHNLSELGTTAVTNLNLTATQTQVQIDFFASGFSAGETLRYQYRLEGADRDWSAPSEQRTVNYANLAPGTYRFLVRAVSSDELTSPEPATVSFMIPPPIWRQWWFIAMTGAILALLAYCLYRYRVAQLIELERVRTRIATDLHDDIGSALSQIAILSEVAQRHLGQPDAAAARPLGRIANLSRESVDAMSDIVWAINPLRDRLSDLTHRMRYFANEVLAGRDIEFRFRALDAEQDQKIDAETRRQVFLIFKETITNIVRHSACTEVDIEFSNDRTSLVLAVRDNGCGFDPAAVMHGHGLASLRQRAETLGGRFEVASSRGHGTTIALKAPLGN